MTNVSDNFALFTAAQASMRSDFSPTPLTGAAIYSFNLEANVVPGTKPRIPLFIRTGQQSFGNPPERKRFKQIELHGRGTCHARVYVDGFYVNENEITLSEDPEKSRRLGIPTGTRGYTIEMEISGDANIRALEYSYEDMVSTS